MKRERLIKNLLLAVIFFIVIRFGIIPMLTGSSLKDYLNTLTAERYTFAENEYAIIVVGSDPEGVAAAVTSARTGLKTLLITEDSDLGGYIKHSMIVDVKPDEGIIEGKMRS